MAIQAVLTGDIVNSTRLGQAVEKKLLRGLQQLLAGHRFEFYRGDSFQVYVKNAGTALQTALLCRTAAISIAGNAATVSSDIRISIGIGKVKPPPTGLGAAKGEAFVLSGRAFDEIIKKDIRLAIASTNELANEGLQVIADYINSIFKMMTGKQAGVIFELLKGETQQAVAVKLKKSKSTINQHVNAGRWPEIEKLVEHYQNIINQLL
ncbi:MAG TPA: hypothetical protein VK645_20145 [Chitinophagaceae bacterium]|nr:hypothetical protein [Chitinophagaceae bacterium]